MQVFSLFIQNYKNDKTLNVSKDDEGGITLESEDHSISFSCNMITTPPTEETRTIKEIK